MFQRSRAGVLREGLNFCSFNLFLQSSRRNKKLSFKLMCVLMLDGFQVKDKEHQLYIHVLSYTSSGSIESFLDKNKKGLYILSLLHCCEGKMGSDCLGFFFLCHDAKYFVRFNLAKLLENVNCTVVENYPALVAHVLIESFIL